MAGNAETARRPTAKIGDRLGHVNCQVRRVARRVDRNDGIGRNPHSSPVGDLNADAVLPLKNDRGFNEDFLATHLIAHTVKYVWRGSIYRPRRVLNSDERASLPSLKPSPKRKAMEYADSSTVRLLKASPRNHSASFIRVLASA